MRTPLLLAVLSSALGCAEAPEPLDLDVEALEPEHDLGWVVPEGEREDVSPPEEADLRDLPDQPRSRSCGAGATTPAARTAATSAWSSAAGRP